MSATLRLSELALPGHLDLPSTDGRIVENSAEPFQSGILTSSIGPVLAALHPDKQYFVGQDVGIYYRHTDPPLDGCKAPDWFYVPNVPPKAADGTMRRSYVLWRERALPSIVIEIVSGDGSEERDDTPNTGKFWVYEQVLKVPFYAIFDGFDGSLACFLLEDGAYVPMEPDAHGRFAIPFLNVSLGIWEGAFQNYEWCWLRFFDAEGQLLLTDEESTRREKKRADQEKAQADRAIELAAREKEKADRANERAEKEKERADAANVRADAANLENARLREQLARLGIDPGNPVV